MTAGSGSPKSSPLARLQSFGADLALVNGNVITMADQQPRAQAVAARAGRIVGVGSDREIKTLCGRGTEVVDLGGRTLVPGFVETHNHVSAYSHTIVQLDLTPEANASIADILEKVRADAASKPPGTWIEGYGYDHSMLDEKRHIDRHDLDTVAPEHPVHLWHITGHYTATNSKGLEMVGYTRDTPDPEGGRILRDEHGEPTGVLSEPGTQLPLLHLIPPKTADERAEGLRLVDEEYVEAGVTSTHDANMGVFGGLTELEAYEAARSRGIFRPRVYALLWFTMLEDLTADGADLAELGIRTGAGDEWFRLGGVKIWADGSFGGGSAAFSEPYHDPPTLGQLNHTQEELTALVKKYHDAGFQLAIHANGDVGIETVLTAFEAAQAANPRLDHRHRIEHAAMLDQSHIRRMAELGVTATFFTSQFDGKGDRLRDVLLGPERASRVFPTKWAEEAGIRFGLHGDCPVTPISPLTCLYTAVARETESGAVIGPDQRVSVDSALRALTVDGAYLEFGENNKGSIETGKLADFVVISEDPYRIDPSDLKDLEVLSTVIGGDVVYDTG